MFIPGYYWPLISIFFSFWILSTEILYRLSKFGIMIKHIIWQNTMSFLSAHALWTKIKQTYVQNIITGKFQHLVSTEQFWIISLNIDFSSYVLEKSNLSIIAVIHPRQNSKATTKYEPCCSFLCSFDKKMKNSNRQTEICWSWTK